MGDAGGHGGCRTTQHIWDQAFQFSPVFLNLLPINLTRGSFTPRVPTAGSAFHAFPLLLAQTLHPEALPRYSPITEAFLGLGDGSPVPPPGYRSPASWQPVPGMANLALGTAQPSLFFHQAFV